MDAEALEVMDMTKSVPLSTDRPGPVLQGLLDLRPTPIAERMAVTAEDAVAQGLAVAKVYAFVSIDYPGASGSWVFDGDGNDAVGGFQFDGGTEVFTAFTFMGGVYQILAVPNSTISIATGFNSFGLIIGVYNDLTSVRRSFAYSGGSFSDVQFPGANLTEAIGVNDAGQIVGDYSDAANVQHGFLSSGGVFTTIDVPGLPAQLQPGSTPPAILSGVGRTPRAPMAFCVSPAASPPSTFRSPRAPQPGASTTPERLPATTATPEGTPMASFIPPEPSAQWM